LSLREGKITSYLLVSRPEIEELVIDRSFSIRQVGSELADGIMRCKKLKSLVLKNSDYFLDDSIHSIVYSLAFSPKLKYLSIQNASSKKLADMSENLSKLLSISGSLQYLNLDNFKELYEYLKWNFWKAVGENIILKGLN